MFGQELLSSLFALQKKANKGRISENNAKHKTNNNNALWNLKKYILNSVGNTNCMNNTGNQT